MKNKIKWSQWLDCPCGQCNLQVRFPMEDMQTRVKPKIKSKKSDLRKRAKAAGREASDWGN